MLKISREEALALGRTTFRTGKRCRRGHDGFRYVSTGQCVDCLRDRNAAAHHAAQAFRAKPFTFYLRPKDLAEVKALVTALYAVDGLMPPKLPADIPVPAVAAPEIDSEATRRSIYQTWVRANGKVWADAQCLANGWAIPPDVVAEPVAPLPTRNAWFPSDTLS